MIKDSPRFLPVIVLALGNQEEENSEEMHSKAPNDTSRKSNLSGHKTLPTECITKQTKAPPLLGTVGVK